MALVLSFIVLTLFACVPGSVIDTTDDHYGETIHTMSALARESTRKPIRIHYDI
jgi:hypothetical protein